MHDTAEPALSAGAGAPAVLFDVDGSLVDSNYLHVHTWQRALSYSIFSKCGTTQALSTL